ncbi:MAG: hypothetical protein KF832_19030 [Caldilineaceae bacterium]|nr:hypothetical protein [Caldilineaceae bacterium]
MMQTTRDEFSKLYRALLDLLMPHLMTIPDRQAILGQAVLGQVVYGLDLHGAADIFTARMVNTLLRQSDPAANPPAIIALLNVIHDRSGYDKQVVIAELRCRLQAYLASGEPIPWPAPNRQFTVIAAWLAERVSLAGIPPDLDISWAGRFIFLNRKLTAGIRLEQLWTVMVWLTIWVATNGLVTPMLRWPLADVTQRGWAALLYSLATLGMPFVVALVSPVDRQGEMVLTNRAAWMRFWYLKVIGACTGYSLVAGAVLVALVVHYLGGSVPRGIQWLLTLVPLLFSHIGARRIPADRLKMYGEIRLHAVDRLVIGVWLLLGPGLAGAIYVGYPALTNPGMGFLVLLAGSAVLLWEKQKVAEPSSKQARLWVDCTRITLFGLFLPFLFVLLIFGFTLTTPWPTPSDWWVLLLTTPYLLGISLLVATIFVRNPPTVAIRALVALWLALWLIAFALRLDLRLGVALAFVLVICWLGWGHRRWRPYLWVHPSFGLLWVMLGGAIYLWVQALVPPWGILVSWLIVITGLVTWAFHKPAQTKEM